MKPQNDVEESKFLTISWLSESNQLGKLSKPKAISAQEIAIINKAGTSLSILILCALV
jgi:hypothetical protein